MLLNVNEKLQYDRGSYHSYTIIHLMDISTKYKTNRPNRSAEIVGTRRKMDVQLWDSHLIYLIVISRC